MPWYQSAAGQTTIMASDLVGSVIRPCPGPTAIKIPQTTNRQPSTGIFHMTDAPILAALFKDFDEVQSRFHSEEEFYSSLDKCMRIDELIATAKQQLAALEPKPSHKPAPILTALFKGFDEVQKRFHSREDAFDSIDKCMRIDELFATAKQQLVALEPKPSHKTAQG